MQMRWQSEAPYFLFLFFFKVYSEVVCFSEQANKDKNTYINEEEFFVTVN